MKIDFEISPRQSGKTIKLADSLVRNYLNRNPYKPINMIYVVASHAMKVNVERTLHSALERIGIKNSGLMATFIKTLKDCIVSIESLQPQHWGKYDEVAEILVDEYLMFSPEQMMRLQRIIFYMERLIKLENVIIKTTSYQLYTPSDLMVAKMIFYTNPGMTVHFTEKALEEFEKFRYNLIIHPATTINCPAENMRNNLSPLEYETAILGRYLKRK